MSEKKEKIEFILEDFDEHSRGGVVDFQTQLLEAQNLAQQIEDEDDLHLIELRTAAHTNMHVRRLTALAMQNCRYRLVEKALPLVIRQLKDPFRWVRYDAVRFFSTFTPLEPRGVQGLEELNEQEQDSDVKKALTKTFQLLQECDAAYRSRDFKTFEMAGARFQAPPAWTLKRQTDEVVFLEAPSFEYSKLSKHSFLSYLKIQIIKAKTAVEVSEMSDLNIELLADSATFIESTPIEISERRQRMFFCDQPPYPPEYPTVAYRDHLLGNSCLVVGTVRSPMMHFEPAKARNTAILDSIQIIE